MAQYIDKDAVVAEIERLREEEYLSKALAFIVEGIPEENICEELLDIPQEAEYCENNCQNLQKDCVKRFLNYYEEE